MFLHRIAVTLLSLLVLIVAPAAYSQDAPDAPADATEVTGAEPDPPATAPRNTSFIIRGSNDCGTAEIDTIERTSRLTDSENQTLDDIRLGDTVAVRVKGIDDLLACAEVLDKPVVLYIDRRPFPQVVRYAATGQDDTLHFDLRINHVDGVDPEPWRAILGSPGFGTRSVELSVGLLDHGPIARGQDMKLAIVRGTSLLLWCVMFAILVTLFWILVRRTRLIRNGLTDMPAGKGTYSLARTQAAWWFFFVIASYLLIGNITGDWAGSINTTALTLLGIGGATAVLGSALDNTSPEATAVARERSLKEKRDEKAAIEKYIADPAKAVDKTINEARLAEVNSQIRKLRGESEHFLIDLVSDANGASFHRFQMMAWTVVLSVVFIVEVYRNLAMPSFDATLLGLMGISSATYLGLKSTEATTPTPAPPATPTP